MTQERGDSELLSSLLLSLSRVALGGESERQKEKRGQVNRRASRAEDNRSRRDSINLPFDDGDRPSNDRSSLLLKKGRTGARNLVQLRASLREGKLASPIRPISREGAGPAARVFGHVLARIFPTRTPPNRWPTPCRSHQRSCRHDIETLMFAQARVTPAAALRTLAATSSQSSILRQAD